MLLLLICGDIESQPGPYRNIPELKTLCSKRGLKICHINIRGLRGKFDEIKNILSYHKIDILTLNELFLNKEKVKFEIPGFTFIRKDRKKGTGGGVGMFIRTELDFKRLNKFEDEEIESIYVKFQPKSSKPFIVGTIYRPPDSSDYLSKKFETVLSSRLETLEDINKEIIILGDLNIDYLKKDNETIKDFFRINGFVQLIKLPTRVTETTSTLIDVI